MRAEGVTGRLRGLPDNACLVQGQHDIPGFLLGEVLVDLAGWVVAMMGCLHAQARLRALVDATDRSILLPKVQKAMNALTFIEP